MLNWFKTAQNKLGYLLKQTIQKLRPYDWIHPNLLSDKENQLSLIKETLTWDNLSQMGNSSLKTLFWFTLLIIVKMSIRSTRLFRRRLSPIISSLRSHSTLNKRTLIQRIGFEPSKMTSRRMAFPLSFCHLHLILNKRSSFIQTSKISCTKMLVLNISMSPQRLWAKTECLSLQRLHYRLLLKSERNSGKLRSL